MLASLLIVVIVVIASVLVYALSNGLLGGGTLVTPGGGPNQEALNMEAYSFPSNSSTILNIRNTGRASVTFISYYVKDSSGNTYSNTGWTSSEGAPQNLGVNSLAATAFNIGSTCGGCSLNSGGAAFVFASGPTYSVTVITGRNDQFTFTIIGAAVPTTTTLSVQEYPVTVSPPGTITISKMYYYIRDHALVIQASSSASLPVDQVLADARTYNMTSLTLTPTATWFIIPGENCGYSNDNGLAVTTYLVAANVTYSLNYNCIYPATATSIQLTGLIAAVHTPCTYVGSLPASCTSLVD